MLVVWWYDHKALSLTPVSIWQYSKLLLTTLTIADYKLAQFTSTHSVSVVGYGQVIMDSKMTTVTTVFLCLENLYAEIEVIVIAFMKN